MQNKAESRLAAVETVINTYSRDIFRWALQFTHNKEDAEDLCQDVYLKIFLGLDTFLGKNGCSLRTWLCILVRNEFINKRRHHSIQTCDLEEWMRDSATSTNPAFFSRSDQQTEGVILVDEILSHLQEREKKILFLRYAEGMSLQETAEIMHTTPTAVKMATFWARQKVQMRHSAVGPASFR